MFILASICSTAFAAPQKTKQELWNDAAHQIDLIEDMAGTPIDEGIKETVIAFTVFGFKTYMSCEGHANASIIPLCII